jgi:hypothetical protein
LWNSTVADERGFNWLAALVTQSCVMTSAVDISVEKTLELLDGPLASIAAGIAQDRYAFWLGSGISFGRMASLKELIARVLDHLQQRVTPDAGCRFRRALKEILRLAHLSTADQAAIDLGNSIAAWPHLESLIDRLASDYARLLDQQVDGELPDYLLWHGVGRLRLCACISPYYHGSYPSRRR